jgi:subtilisin-like proprotein convertase family protein
MNAVSNRLGHARFGVSGARDNCFSPTGDRCDGPPPPPPGDETRFESNESVDIPDDDPAGASSIISADTDATIAGLTVELDITHTYVGDLRVALTHGATTAVLWDRQGGGEDDIHQSFDVSDFDGQAAAGEWKLHVVDGAGRDVGTIDGWAVVVTPEG